MIYSYAVSALSNYVQSVDSKTLDYQKKLAILESIRVTHENMPQNLYDKINPEQENNILGAYLKE